MNSPTTVRVDSWIWAVRLIKTRSLATAACRAGHVRINGDKVKAAQSVRVGDEVRIREGGFDRSVVVERLLVKRVGAPVAAESYTDTTPPPPPREEVPFVPMRDRGAGRPTKRERRDLEKLRGRDDYSDSPSDQ
ncbi:MAG: RNA-binding S4 domain-containing protein [Microbacteriaceae bacterium]